MNLSVLGETYILVPEDVQTDEKTRRLYVTCQGCHERFYIGSWAAAHLGTCGMVAHHQCGATIMIEKEAM